MSERYQITEDAHGRINITGDKGHYVSLIADGTIITRHTRAAIRQLVADLAERDAEIAALKARLERLRRR